MEGIHDHDLAAELNAKRRPDWWKAPANPETLGPAGAAINTLLEPWRPKHPSNTSSIKQFLYGMQRQAMGFLSEWYERADTQLKDLSFLEATK